MRKYRYINYLCVVIDNPPKTWNNIDYKVFPNFNNQNNQAKLENEFFNKNWSYYCSDEIKLRQLLTPWTQEQLLTVKYLYSFNRFNNSSFWYGQDEAKILIFDCKIEKTLEATINNLAKDIVNDLNSLETIFQDISVYKAVIF